MPEAATRRIEIFSVGKKASGKQRLSNGRRRSTAGDESRRAPLLAQLAPRHPAVYFKSWARTFGRDVRIRVTVSSTAAAEGEVEQAWQALVPTLRAAALGAREVPPG
jgi:hypothetical protein